MSTFKLNKSAISLAILALFPAYSANAAFVFYKYVDSLQAEPINQHPAYVVNPVSAQVFPSTTEGSNSAGILFTVSSTGNRPVKNLSFNTTGNFTAYDSTCGTSLAPGSSCNVTVRFNPASAGAKSGSLTIGASNVSGFTSVGLSGTGTPIPASAHTVADTGADVSITVPSGGTSLTAKVWGAAGGSMSNGWAFHGGVGGYARCDIAVTPGETLTVRTGRGGGKGVSGLANGAGGGGYSGIFRGTTPLIIAGGGGGAENTNGGNGGGAAGNGPGSTGASTTAGGTGPCDRGCGGNGTHYNGGAGYTSPTVAGGWPGGGAGASKAGDWGGAGGGAGYWGGAGTPGSGGGTSGAGGGSGYTGGCIGGTITTGTTSFVNSGATSVPADNDADYSTGVGSYVSNGNGNSGRVVLYY